MDNIAFVLPHVFVHHTFLLLAGFAVFPPPLVVHSVTIILGIYGKKGGGGVIPRPINVFVLRTVLMSLFGSLPI